MKAIDLSLSAGVLSFLACSSLRCSLGIPVSPRSKPLLKCRTGKRMG